MKKNIIIASLFLIIMIALIIVKVINDSRYVYNIKSFEYSFGGGMSMHSGVRLTYKNNEITIKKDGESKTDNYKVDDDFEVKLSEILKKHNIKSWDGYNKVDKNIMDGSSFTVHIILSEGKLIDAHGYMRYPRNFDQFSKDICDLFYRYENERI